MARRVGLMVGAVALLTLAGMAPAAAGGFCSGQEGEILSDERGTQVSMSKNCFSPTVLRVQAGERVTFVNDDVVPHNVTGAVGSFGDPHADILAGDQVAFRFDEEGVYPFACTLHPGMMGAVVVGDGVGDAAAAAAIEPPPPGAGARTTADEASSSFPLGLSIGIAAIVVIAGIASLVAMSRRKEKTPDIARA